MPYTTKQRQAVLRILESRGERLTAAPELADALRREGAPVGLATVYRHLDRLAEEGLVHKVEARAGARYQYCTRRMEGGICHLLRCRGCGRLEHLDCAKFRAFYRDLLETHGVRVDPDQTVLSGLCSRCAKREAACGEC